MIYQKKHVKIEVEHDEIEQGLNKMGNATALLKQTIERIKDSSNDLKEVAYDLNNNASFSNETCGQISEAIENVASGAISQAEETSVAAQNMSEMSDSLGYIKNNIDELHNIADSMDIAKTNALSTLSELQKVNNVMANEINSTSVQVNITNESVNQIKKAVEMIQDIAEQTKLLSLNASIEAAHAGEQGRGFAVVAEEIGKLANQSANSSNEIENILHNLSDNYSLIIENVKSTFNNMSVQNDKLLKTQNVFETLESDINKTVEQITAINTMVNNLDRDIKVMVDSVANLSAISEENSASTQETTTAIEELRAVIQQVSEKAQMVNNEADELMKKVSIFKTE